MPRLVPKLPFDGTFVALDDAGRVEAEGHLAVDMIPQGPGSHIVGGVQFITHPVEDVETDSLVEIMRSLNGGV